VPMDKRVRQHTGPIHEQAQRGRPVSCQRATWTSARVTALTPTWRLVVTSHGRGGRRSLSAGGEGVRAMRRSSALSRVVRSTSRRKAIVEPVFGQAKELDASDASRCEGAEGPT